MRRRRIRFSLLLPDYTVPIQLQESRQRVQVVRSWPEALRDYLAKTDETGTMDRQSAGDLRGFADEPVAEIVNRRFRHGSRLDSPSSVS